MASRYRRQTRRWKRTGKPEYLWIGYQDNTSYTALTATTLWTYGIAAADWWELNDGKMTIERMVGSVSLVYQAGAAGNSLVGMMAAIIDMANDGTIRSGHPNPLSADPDDIAWRQRMWHWHGALDFHYDEGGVDNAKAMQVNFDTKVRRTAAHLQMPAFGWQAANAGRISAALDLRVLLRTGLR